MRDGSLNQDALGTALYLSDRKPRFLTKIGQDRYKTIEKQLFPKKDLIDDDQNPLIIDSGTLDLRNGLADFSNQSILLHSNKISPRIGVHQTLSPDHRLSQTNDLLSLRASTQDDPLAKLHSGSLGNTRNSMDQRLATRFPMQMILD